MNEPKLLIKTADTKMRKKTNQVAKDFFQNIKAKKSVCWQKYDIIKKQVKTNIAPYFFLTAICLPHSQIWAIIEGTASLNRS